MPSKLLCVIGMHRSGTSAVAGTLARLGVDFGNQLMPASSDNPKGYYEAMPVVRAHDRLLALNGRAWCRRPILRGSAFWSREGTLALDSLCRWYELNRMGEVDLPGVKDPRMCVMLPLWRRFADRMGLELLPVIVRRKPEAIVSSLMAREGWDAERAEMLIAVYNQEIFKWSQMPGAVEAEFADFLIEPVATLGDKLALPRDNCHQAWQSVDMFVDGGLVHHGV